MGPKILQSPGSQNRVARAIDWSALPAAVICSPDADSQASDTRDARSSARVGNAVLAPRAEQTNEGIADANLAARTMFCGVGASVGGESAPGPGRLK